MGAKPSNIASDASSETTSACDGQGAIEIDNERNQELQDIKTELENVKESKRKEEKLSYELEKEVIELKRKNHDLRRELEKSKKRERSLEMEINDLRRSWQRERREKVRIQRILNRVKRNL